MGTIRSVYFVPNTVLPEGEFRKRIGKILDQWSITDGYYDEKKDDLACGGDFFFEYATIFDGSTDQIVPRAESDGYKASCPHCKAEVTSDVYYTIFNFDADNYGNSDIPDMKAIPIHCEHCDTITPLQQIGFNKPVFFTRQYINFSEIEEDAPDSLQTDLEREMECSFSVIYEGF